MNIYCGRCRQWLKHYCRGKCRNCYQFTARKTPRVKPRIADDNLTAEELDALIAQNYPTMPQEMIDDWKHQEGTGGDDTHRRVAGVCRILLVPGRMKR